MQRGRQNLASGPRPAEIGGDQRFYGKFGRLRDAGGDALRCRCAIGPAHQPSVWLYRAVAKQMKQKRCRHALDTPRSEEHTSELQSLMRISYAVFCLKKKTHKT